MVSVGICMESEEKIKIQSELRSFFPLFFRDADEGAHVLWVSRGEATKTASRSFELLHSGYDDLR